MSPAESEAEMAKQLDRLLRKYIPTISDARRHALIAILPIYLWSIYGGRPAEPRTTPGERATVPIEVERWREARR